MKTIKIVEDKRVPPGTVYVMNGFQQLAGKIINIGEEETVYFQEGFCEHCDSEIFELDEAEDMFCCSKRMWEVYEAQEYLDGEEKDN